MQEQRHVGMLTNLHEQTEKCTCAVQAVMTSMPTQAQGFWAGQHTTFPDAEMPSACVRTRLDPQSYAHEKYKPHNLSLEDISNMITHWRWYGYGSEVPQCFHVAHNATPLVVTDPQQSFDTWQHLAARPPS